MKAKYLAITAAASALLLSACQRNELGGGSLSGEEVTVGISAMMPLDGGAVVKSDAEPGKGDEVNRCIMQVYLADDVDLSNATKVGEPKTVEVTDGKASFGSLQLVAGHTYRLVFWADCAATGTDDALTDQYYSTEMFPVVTFKEGVTYAGNDDSRDAFFASYKLEVDGPSNHTVKLHRPFGQLNIITSDYSVVETSFPALVPQKVSLTFSKVPQGINLLTGALAETFVKPLTGASVYVAAVTEPAVASGSKHLSFDYIFAPEGEQYSIPEITMSFDDAEGNEVASVYKFVNLPVQRNYRTNVTGALLTDRTGIDIEVVSDFDRTKEISEEVTSEESAQDALNAGFTDIVFTEQIENVRLTLPENSSADYNIAFSAGVLGNVTISSNTYTGHLSINCNGQATGVLTVDIPQGTATIDDGEWASVIATTAKNTIVVGEGATVASLTVKAGNIEIYGRVGSIVFENDESIVTVFTVYDAVSLKYAMTLAMQGRCLTVVLGNDIELDGGIANAGNTAGGEDIAFVLDLSGNKLSISHDKTLMNSSNGASVTIRNGDLSVMGVPSDKYTLCASDKGKITLEGLNYETTGGGVGVYPCTNGGEIYVKKCNINTSFYNEGNGTTGNGPAVMTTAKGATAENTKDVLITIEDTHMESFSDAIIFNVNGRINIKNCTTKAQWHGLVLRGGTAVVENTVFTHDNHNNDPESVSQGWYNEDWGSGNGQPRAAITVGDRGNGAYQYPSNLTLINTKAEVIGQGVNLFASMYVWANENPDYGVTITYDDRTEFVGGKVIYGNEGKNIIVNSKPASELTE